MFSYEKHERNNGTLFVISKDNESIGSLFLEADKELLIRDLISKLNAWDTDTERRTREGIQTVTK